MVYCGKPSRGCQMCRTRRIKCDETKPTCKQCAKSRRQCPGYKDEFDLVFRNETQATERRARKATKKALVLKQGRDSISSDDSSNSTSPPMAASHPILASLNTPITEQATCHFISNYVLIPRQGTSRGFLDFIIPLLRDNASSHHFMLAFEACALGSLGNHVGTGVDFEKQALGKYTKALAATFAAIKDPEMAKQDATLMSVLLLGLFENITARQLGMLAWGSHIEGAIQLVKSRGRKQLRTKTGVSLFIAVRTQMIIHTLSTGKSPVMGIEWWFSDEAIRDEHAANCQRLNIRTGELRAEVNRLMTTAVRNPETVELMLDMIRRCQSVDQDCVSWARDPPEAFRWKTVAWQDHIPHGDYARAEAYPGRIDAYQDLWIASIWGLQRCSRLILASLIVRCTAWVCSPVDYRTTPEYATAARTCVETITDIIASVPYQLGWFSKRKELLERANLSAFGCGDEDVPKGLPGYFLTWPLACVQGQDYTSDSQKAWVVGRLKYIGNQLGVRYANMLTKLDIRIPSMLIRRDGLMATPYPMAHNFEKLLSARIAPPQAGYSMNPLQQREAMQKELVEKQKAELVRKAMGTSGQVDEWTAQTWLALQNVKPVSTEENQRRA